MRHVVQVCPRPRKSSLFDKWIQEQQRYTDPPGHTRSHSSPLNALLAYPDISGSTLDRPGTAQGLLSQEINTPNLVEDDDIPQRLAAEFSSMAVTDAPATIRSSKRSPRMSFTPSSFRHFNLVFRSCNSSNPSQQPQSQSEESGVPPSRPSSRLSLFSRSNRNNSGGTTTSRATLTPQSTPQKRPKRASQISYGPPSPRKVSPIKIRSRTPSSRWRPTVLGHFGPVEPIAPAASQTSILPPPSDSNYSPSRPSLSSSIDASHTNTSLTVPSIESSSIHHSPTSSEKKVSPPLKANTRPSTPAVQPQAVWSNDTKRYSTPPIAPVPPKPHFHQQHNRGRLTSFTSPNAKASSATSLQSAYPSSINTASNIRDVFTSSTERDTTASSPISPLRPNTANSAVGGTSPYGMVGPYPRMPPYVYNNGASSQPASISSRRGANAFDGIPSAWRYLSTPSTTGAACGFEQIVDDADDEFATGSTCSYAFSASQAHTHTSNQHQEPHHQDQRSQEQEKKRKKADVVYASAASQGGGGGGTLSKMTSFTNLNLAQLAPMTMRAKRKKKRLIVSGIAANDLKKYEGVKRWCESFGEVRQILRMPNGDLVISFQSAEVADTVCRVRAKVFINGVGSVQLSWTTEKKR